MARIAIIGGTGLNQLAAGGAAMDCTLDTPYGRASSQPQRFTHQGHEVVFFARHGQPHRIAPHAINYRANIWLLAELKVEGVFAVNAVGGIRAQYGAGAIVVPDQIIDYTSGRESSFSDQQRLLHIDFTYPYDPHLRSLLLGAGRAATVFDGGVYACTQGPRLETAAEVERLARDGCDLVGMTGMPEAALARELEIPYAAICLVVNVAAGRTEGVIEMSSIEAVIKSGMSQVEQVLLAAIAEYK